jgi:hypothetical protein
LISSLALKRVKPSASAALHDTEGRGYRVLIMFVRLASSDLTDEQRISTPTRVIRFELRKYQAGHGSP